MLLLVGLVVVALVVAIVALPRLTGGGGDSLTVVGMVTLDAPVVGADVRIVDEEGDQLASATTDEWGTFEVDVDPLPELFRVEVSGGDVDEQLLPTPLAAVIERGVADETGPGWVGVDVHLGSTLVAAYLDDHGGTIDEAETALRAHLGLDDDTDLGPSLHDHPEFAATTFLEVADTGVEAQIENTVAAMADGETASYPAPQANEVINGCDLSALPVSCQGAVLHNMRLQYANFEDADLRGVTFTGANLYRANLTRADLRAANLTATNLNRASLLGAHLSDAKLVGARMIGVDLSGANLSGAALVSAELPGANLTDANLSGANLSGAILTDATLCRTTMPDGSVDDSGC
jgi:hypothetical protein